MFDNLVTYHLHQQPPLPPLEAVGYQYILAANGLFIRGETALLATHFLIVPCVVRGLAPLTGHFRLKVERLPATFLERILEDASQTRDAAGRLSEALYYGYYHEQCAYLLKPPQQQTARQVTTQNVAPATTLCELHTHGHLPPFFSQTDDADEQAARIYGVIGHLPHQPTICLRVGLYGYWQPLPVTAVFTGPGPMRDGYGLEAAFRR